MLTLMEDSRSAWRRAGALARRRWRVAALLPLAVALACGEAGPTAAPADRDDPGQHAMAAVPRAMDARVAPDTMEGTTMQAEAAAVEWTEDLASEDAEIRREAVYQIDADEGGVDTLLRVLREDREPEVRLAAVTQLSAGEGPQVLAALLAALKDSDADVLDEALNAIESQADASVLPELFPLLEHPDPEVRERAREAIEYVQD